MGSDTFVNFNARYPVQSAPTALPSPNIARLSVSGHVALLCDAEAVTWRNRGNERNDFPRRSDGNINVRKLYLPSSRWTE